MHERDDLSYTRGYEWFLMQEAQKRNPAIRGYGLPWYCRWPLAGPNVEMPGCVCVVWCGVCVDIHRGFPAWIGNGGNPAAPAVLLGQDQADYMTKWVQGAEKVRCRLRAPQPFCRWPWNG
jgi:hypothetical protein